MDLSARWDKILHDIWSNRTRSLLVIVTIAIGIAVVGMINNTVRMLKRDLFGQYADRNPASAVIYGQPFPRSLDEAVDGMREVEIAEVQSKLLLLAQAGETSCRNQDSPRRGCRLNQLLKLIGSQVAHPR